MTTTKVKAFQVTQTIEVPEDGVRDLLTTAFEGGSNYWCSVKDGYSYKKVERLLAYPGEQLIVVENETGEEKALDYAAVKRGLDLLATKYPKRFFEFVNEEADAEVADTFLQLCVLGEVVYG